MLRFFGDCWRRLKYAFYRYLFRRRWQRIYRSATEVRGVEGLFLSVCSNESRHRVLSSVERMWPRIPRSIQEDMRQQRKVLQRRWDQRAVGIPLHLPVFGVFTDCFEYAGDHGTFIGSAIVASARSGFTDSPDSLVKLFDAIFLSVWTSDLKLTDERLDLQIAKRLASYYLQVKHQTNASSLLCGCHDGTDELVASWGITAGP